VNGPTVARTVLLAAAAAAGNMYGTTMRGGAGTECSVGCGERTSEVGVPGTITMPSATASDRGK